MCLHKLKILIPIFLANHRMTDFRLCFTFIRIYQKTSVPIAFVDHVYFQRQTDNFGGKLLKLHLVAITMGSEKRNIRGFGQ